MREIATSDYTRVRIWSRPPARFRFTPDEWYEHSRPCCEVGFAAACCAELFVPLGGRAAYGALGGHFTPRQDGTFRARVAVGDDLLQSLDSTLAGGVDTVFAGLAPDYARAVLETVAEPTEAPVGSGDLVFDHAAHGRVGSSPRAFHVITGVLIDLLRRAPGTCSDDEIKAIVNRHWRRIWPGTEVD